MEGLPTTAGTSFCCDPNRIGNHLSRLATSGNPHPGVVGLFEHKRAIRSSSSSVVEVASSGSGASKVVWKGGSCAPFFDPIGHGGARDSERAREAALEAVVLLKYGWYCEVFFFSLKKEGGFSLKNRVQSNNARFCACIFSYLCGWF